MYTVELTDRYGDWYPVKDKSFDDLESARKWAALTEDRPQQPYRILMGDEIIEEYSHNDGLRALLNDVMDGIDFPWQGADEKEKREKDD